MFWILRIADPRRRSWGILLIRSFSLSGTSNFTCHSCIISFAWQACSLAGPSILQEMSQVQHSWPAMNNHNAHLIVVMLFVLRFHTNTIMLQMRPSPLMIRKICIIPYSFEGSQWTNYWRALSFKVPVFGNQEHYFHNDPKTCSTPLRCLFHWRWSQKPFEVTHHVVTQLGISAMRWKFLCHTDLVWSGHDFAACPATSTGKRKRNEGTLVWWYRRKVASLHDICRDQFEAKYHFSNYRLLGILDIQISGYIR